MGDEHRFEYEGIATEIRIECERTEATKGPAANIEIRNFEVLTATVQVEREIHAVRKRVPG